MLYESSYNNNNNDNKNNNSYIVYFDMVDSHINRHNVYCSEIHRLVYRIAVHCTVGISASFSKVVNDCSRSFVEILCFQTRPCLSETQSMRSFWIIHGRGKGLWQCFKFWRRDRNFSSDYFVIYSKMIYIALLHDWGWRKRTCWFSSIWRLIHSKHLMI